jgi:hypothetical protein
MMPLNVAHSFCETSQKRTGNSPLIGFLPLKALPLIDVRLYLGVKGSPPFKDETKLWDTSIDTMSHIRPPPRPFGAWTVQLELF